jgi:hypothetical protein
MQDKLLRKIGYCDLCGRQTTSLIDYSLGRICGGCERIVETLDVCPGCQEIVNRLNSINIEDGMRTKYYHHECYFKKG